MVNVANQNRDLIITGTVAAGATGVTVSLPGIDPISATLGAGATRFADQTWEAVVPAAALKKLPERRVQMTVQFTGRDIPAAQATQTVPLLKDTSAPAVPTVAPKPGVYTRAQNVRLSAPNLTEILYTTAAGAARTKYTGPIRVNRTTTIRAQAVDEAGNFSPVATFRYTIRTRR